MTNPSLTILREYHDTIGAIIEADREGEVFTEADVRAHLEAEEALDELESL